MVQHEYIKRSDRVGSLFIPCNLFNFMGDDMNERLKKLAVQAGLDVKEIRKDGSLTLYAFENFDLERFAKLLHHDERESCAVLVENRFSEGLNFEGCAAAIRARGKK
jgi:hypothetical protein